MQKRIVGFITVILVALALFLFRVPVQAAEFTADWFNTRQSVTNQGKIYVKDDMICIEVLEGPELGIIIADQGKRFSIVMLPNEKIYIEVPKNLSILEPDTDMIMGSEKKLMGTETVNGRSCDKYQYVTTGTTTATITQWIAKDLKYPVKIVYHGEGGNTAEVINIKEGPVGANAFHVRPGYTKKEVGKVGKLTKGRPVKKVAEFSLKGEGRDMDLTSIEKNVQPGQDLMIIIEGDSRYRVESKGKFSLHKGAKREKIKELKFTLKPGEEKSWDFPADREINSVSFGVYGKGDIKVRIEQGDGGRDQAVKAQKPSEDDQALKSAEKPPAGKLDLSNIVFCSIKPKGYMVYNEHPKATYKPGQTVWIYMNLDGVSHNPNPDGTKEVWIKLHLRVKAPNGDTLLDQDLYNEHKNYQKKFNPGEMFLRVNLNTVSGMAEGRYIVGLELKDNLAGEQASASSVFSLKK
jgi:hypothetical protein